MLRYSPVLSLSKLFNAVSYSVYKLSYIDMEPPLLHSFGWYIYVVYVLLGYKTKKPMLLHCTFIKGKNCQYKPMISNNKLSWVIVGVCLLGKYFLKETCCIITPSLSAEYSMYTHI